MSDWLKAITIREPWCSAVADGHKLVENRRRGFPGSYRGIVLLHAGLQWSNRGLEDERIHHAYPTTAYEMIERARQGLGCVIGQAELVDVHRDAGCCRPWGESEYHESSGARQTEIVHLVFEQPRRWATPVPARGKIGLWIPSAQLEELAL